MTRTQRNIAIGAFVALVAFLIWVYGYNKPAKKKKVALIVDAIKNNIDLTGTPDEGLKDKIDTSKAEGINWTEADKAKANKLAEKINDSLGYFTSDDEQAVQDAIKESGNQRFLGLVATVFYDNEGLTLYEFFDRHLNTAEKNVILDVINKLPA